jgi:hypothetical protein
MSNGLHQLVAKKGVKKQLARGFRLYVYKLLLCSCDFAGNLGTSPL